MAKKSAGLLMYRFSDNELEVFLVHPGALFGQKKIWDHGRFQKANTLSMKRFLLMSPGVNSEKKPGMKRMGILPL